MTHDPPTTWPTRVDIPVAWGEMDAYGHVNNAVYLRWIETARVAFFAATGVTARMEDERIGPILARTSIDFRRPVTFPDTIRVMTTATRIGRRSFDMAYRLTSTTRGDDLVAEAQGVIVIVDYASGRSMPIWPDLRRSLAGASALEPGGP